MIGDTVWRARTILKRREVKIIGASPKEIHFQVKQRNGAWCDVYRYVDKHGRVLWDCNAIDADKYNGCIWVKPSGEPRCSHSKACALWLEGYDEKWWKLGGKNDMV